jgi:hypothetical protein
VKTVFFTLILLISSSSLSAEIPKSTQASEHQKIALSKLPDELFGSRCNALKPPMSSNLLALRICSPKDMKLFDSLIVSSENTDKALTFNDLASKMRQGSLEKVQEVISEEKFVIPSAPAALGLRAIYKKASGIRFVWAAYYLGNITRVTMSVPDEYAQDKIESELIRKVFDSNRYQPL